MKLFRKFFFILLSLFIANLIVFTEHDSLVFGALGKHLEVTVVVDESFYDAFSLAANPKAAAEASVVSSFNTASAYFKQFPLDPNINLFLKTIYSWQSGRPISLQCKDEGDAIVTCPSNGVFNGVTVDYKHLLLQFNTWRSTNLSDDVSVLVHKLDQLRCSYSALTDL